MDSSSEDEFTPAVLQRPKVANYTVHESFTVDTRDHEDHTFCGVMFDVACKGFDNCDDGGIPLEFMQITSISVRGDMGPMTVWTTPDGFRGKEHARDSWKLVYECEHGPSRQRYCTLALDTPIQLSPGERCGIYVHSALPGDDAIVYDNSRAALQQRTYEDQVFSVLTGKAHLSNRPFGRHGIWGFPWRDNREFVGNFSYGLRYKLWNPDVHMVFPPTFRSVVRTLFLCAGRPESPLHFLQNEVILYILNMCKHDWFAVEGPQPNAGTNDGATSSGHGGVAALQPFTGPPVLRPSWFRPRFRGLAGPNDDEDEISSDDERWFRPSFRVFRTAGANSSGSSGNELAGGVQGAGSDSDSAPSWSSEPNAQESTAPTGTYAPLGSLSSANLPANAASSDDELEGAFQLAMQQGPKP